MGTVEHLKTEAPTETTASRDAIGALLDRIVAQVMTEIDQVQRALTDLGDYAIASTADVKAQLANLESSGATLKKECQRLEGIAHELRAEHARLVGGNRRADP